MNRWNPGSVTKGGVGSITFPAGQKKDALKRRIGVATQKNIGATATK